MPDWFLSAVATGGPAAAVIMTYMWWRAERRAERYEELWVKASEELPARIIDLSEQHRLTSDRLAGAVWASVRVLRSGRGGHEIPSEPPPTLREVG